MTGPRPRTLALAAALAWAGPSGAASTTIHVTDAAGKPLANAVVWVLPKGQRVTAAPGTKAEITQKDKQFRPQLTVIQTGTAVWFPNLDTVRHHVYSFSPAQRFELRLYAATPAAPVVFDKPGVAILGCNIHDRMQAAVVVVDTPHFAVTDAAGSARLELPAGEHRLRAWHDSLGESGTPAEQPLAVAAGAVQAAIALPRREATP